VESDTHPAKKVLNQLIENYNAASLNGKVIPAKHSEIWSDAEAQQILSQVLEMRLTELNDWRRSHATKLLALTQVNESAVLGAQATQHAEAEIPRFTLMGRLPACPALPRFSPVIRRG
jgi:hypothetical protein